MCLSVSLCCAAVGDAAAAAEDVKKLTAEVSRLVADLDDTREQLSAVKVHTCIKQGAYSLPHNQTQLPWQLGSLHVAP